MPEGFLAFILPVGGGGRPDQGLPVPPQVWPPPVYPDQGLPPSGVGVWPGPGRPDQGLPPGGVGVWPGPGRPDQGLPGPQPTPTPPIFYPPEGPPQPGVPVFPSQGPGYPTPPIYMPPPSSGLAPTHPIVIPPPTEGAPPQAPPGTVIIFVPGYGYILVGATPQPPIAGTNPQPDQGLPATPPSAQPKR